MAFPGRDQTKIYSILPLTMAVGAYHKPQHHCENELFLLFFLDHSLAFLSRPVVRIDIKKSENLVLRAKISETDLLPI